VDLIVLKAQGQMDFAENLQISSEVVTDDARIANL
jgi:hypothetical protein